MSLWTLDKQWNDTINTFAYVSYTYSLGYSDSLADTSYWNFGVGADLYLTEALNVSLTYDTTEALHNYNDNTLMLNLSYLF